jgi:hypothetical protein
MTTPQFCFVLVDLTTDATSPEMRPAPILQTIIDAVSEQVNGPFAEAYGQGAVAFRIASSPADRATNEIACNFRDTIPEAPGALAYHQIVSGVPDVELGVDLFLSLLDGLVSLSGGFSHEILELLRDAGANGWKDCGTGTMNAEEACDFVQNTGYTASDGAWVSNFVLPSFFIPGASGPWDQLGVMQTQDDVSNGYGIQAASPANVTQISGMMGAAHHHGRLVYVNGNLTELQRKRKSHPYSRTYRRGVRLGALV